MIRSRHGGARTTRRLLVLVAALVAACSVVAGPRPAAANVLARQIDDPTVRALGPITFLGDSVGLGSLLYSPTIVDQLAARGWGPIRARAGVGYNALRSGGPTEARVIYWIELWKSQGWDPADVIINLGANDSANCSSVAGCRAIIQRVLDALGPGHRVWWPMITHLTPGQAERWNAALAELAAERDDFYTWDWPRAMATGGYTSPDGIHLSAPSYRQRSAAIAAEATADMARGRRTGGPAALPAPAGSPSEFVPLISKRLLDTRDTGQPVAAEGVVEIDVSAAVPEGTTAVAVYVSATQTQAAGYLTAYSCSQARPTASSANYGPAATRGAVAIVPVVDGKMCLFTKAGAHLLADLQGAFVPVASDPVDGARLEPLDTPQRLLDTRVTGRAEVLTVAVPAGAAGVIVNLTAVGGAAAGYLTAYRCDAKRPTAAAVNHGPQETVAGAAFVPVGPGDTICIYSKAADADVVVDLTATLRDESGLVFTPVNPTRTIDTRDGTGGWSPVHGQGQTIDARVAPPGARAVSGTLTIADPARAGFLRAWGCGPQPPTSNVNAAAHQVFANLVTTGVDANGTLCVMARSLTTTVFDTTGWWTQP